MTAPPRPTAIVLACACTVLAVLAGCSSMPGSPADASAAAGSASALAVLSNLPREQTIIIENPEGTVRNPSWFNIWAVNAGGRSNGLQQLAMSEFPYGYGWQLNDWPLDRPTRTGVPMIRHGGTIPGFRANYTRWPSFGLTVIVLTNLDRAPLEGLTATLAVRTAPELRTAGSAPEAPSIAPTSLAQ